MAETVLDKFLRYVKVYTTSQEGVTTIPSTQRQFDLANMLRDELVTLGMADVRVDDHAIVYSTLESTLEEDTEVPTVAFFAHMDTSPDEPGENVKPQIIKSYDGGVITYPGNPDLKLSPEDTPELARFVGEDIITSDGTTLLGADDKAGVAEIMTAMEQLIESGKPHGTIKVVFTPDEEVGNGVEALDVDELGADYGYTIDGDMLGVLEVENFNAANGTITLKGYNVHPGYAKGKMVNALRAIPDIMALFPADQAPETTEKYEGFTHPMSVTGDVNEVKIRFLIRDFDHEEMMAKKHAIELMGDQVKQRHPGLDVVVDIKESYRNMREIIDQHPEVVEIAEEAIRRAGVEPIHKPVRGGTDGARLSFRGLPTPNIFSGGMNFHSKNEFIPVIALEKGVETVLGIIDLIVERNKKQ